MGIQPPGLTSRVRLPDKVGMAQAGERTSCGA